MLAYFGRVLDFERKLALRKLDEVLSQEPPKNNESLSLYRALEESKRKGEWFSSPVKVMKKIDDFYKKCNQI